MKTCIFCSHKANTQEHIWPEWILERLNKKREVRGNLRGREGTFALNADFPEYKYRCACNYCNNGWMSRLETEVQKFLAAMMQDIATPLDPEQQLTLARWTVKTAMVSEAPTSKNREHFYTKSEREQLRTAEQIPPRTAIWLARYDGNASIGLFGTDIWSNPGDPIPIHGYVYTVFFNCVVIQLLTIHTESDRPITINPKVGPWNDLLVQVWPSNGVVRWPPKLSFTDTGPNYLMQLIKRWSVGIEK